MKQQTYDKIMYWVDKADFEVSGFGTVKYDGKDFHVVDAILLKQEGGATHTDIDAESLSKAQYELRNAEGDLRFWWHSHVNMQAFMSGTDTTTIKDIAKQGWCVAAVFNKRREYQTALAYTYNTPFAGEQIAYQEKVPLLFTNTLSAEMVAQLDAEYDAHVTKKVYKPLMHGELHDWSGYESWKKYTAEDYKRDDLPAAKKVGQKISEQSWMGKQYASSEITPEIAEEARILGIKPKKWLKMCNTLSIDELDMYFEAINRGMSISEVKRELDGIPKQSFNQTY
jgi:hypothetical protein